MRQALIRGAVLGASLIAAAPSVRAGLNVSPTRVVLQVPGGKTQTGFFTLENKDDAPLEVKVQPEDWAGGISGSRRPVSWLTVQPTILTLGPRKVGKVKYVIRVPKTASGELRVQVFFTTTSAQGTGQMQSRLGAIIYIGIEGTERIDATITRVNAGYAASTPGIAKPDRLDVAIGIQNHGNAHIIPHGEVVLRDEDGQTVAAVKLPEGWGLLPDEEDLYHAIGTGVYLKPGRYSMEIKIFCGADLRHHKAITKLMQAAVSPDGAVTLSEPALPTPPAH